MSIENILANTFRVAGVMLEASLKLAEASASVMEVTAASLASWAERAKAKSDLATIEEWNKITPPSQEDILAVKAKMKKTKEVSEDLNSKL